MWQGTARATRSSKGKGAVNFKCKKINFAIEDAYDAFCKAAFRQDYGPPERQIIAMQDFLDALTATVDKHGRDFDAVCRLSFIPFCTCIIQAN